MAWDSSRPVPWQRLVREWFMYVGLMAVIFVLFFRDNGLIGILAGLLVSGPLYLGFGYILAKFGYQRKSLSELRAETAASSSNKSAKGKRSKKSGSDDTDEDGLVRRSAPAPTSRTGGATGRPGGARKKRKR